ncbi:hypothetical protein K432DRAFT_74748 [Lepidopterella palustris CBS 459.81]|uniref:Secreted protein n=1 Tax=Lepidopterella palustris CBS 459.81 TaxID=1314670 RepID=A0A8E2E850_9PEZI|nr:hypothetical protein K432DRAFT_74748 [Lepidopterella palustris CBS 459.81]
MRKAIGWWALLAYALERGSMCSMHYSMLRSLSALLRRRQQAKATNVHDPNCWKLQTPQRPNARHAKRGSDTQGRIDIPLHQSKKLVAQPSPAQAYLGSTSFPIVS